MKLFILKKLIVKVVQNSIILSRICPKSLTLIYEGTHSHMHCVCCTLSSFVPLLLYLSFFLLSFLLYLQFFFLSSLHPKFYYCFTLQLFFSNIFNVYCIVNLHNSLSCAQARSQGGGRGSPAPPVKISGPPCEKCLAPKGPPIGGHK